MVMKVILFSLIIVISVHLYRSETDFEDYLENPYRELRIPPWSSMDEIKKHYNELVRKYHPDKNKKKGAKEKFLKIQKAYEKIKSARKLEYEEITEEDGPLFAAIQETMILIIAVVLVMGLGYFSVWMSYKVYEYVWKFITCALITFIFVDRLLPHYFKSMNSQFTYSFLISLVLYNLFAILKFVKSFLLQSEKKAVNSGRNENKKRNE